MEQVESVSNNGSSQVVPESSTQVEINEHVVSSDGEGREIFSSESSGLSDLDLSKLDLSEIKKLRKRAEEEGDDFDPGLEEPEGEDSEGDLQGNENLEHTQEQVEEIADSPEPQPQITDEVERAQQQQLVEAADRRLTGVEHQYNQAIATINHLQAKAEELGNDDPRETAEIVYQLKGLYSQVEQLKSDYQALTNYKQNMQIVPKYIPMKYFYKNEIVESFMEDGWTQDRAVNFVDNMFATESPTTIIALAKNAIHRVHTKQ